MNAFATSAADRTLLFWWKRSQAWWLTGGGVYWLRSEQNPFHCMRASLSVSRSASLIQSIGGWLAVPRGPRLPAKACSPQALAPPESLEARCSEAVLRPLSPVVSLASLCRSSDRRGCCCILVVRVYSRSTRAPALEWSKRVADERSRPLLPLFAQIHPLALHWSTLFGFQEADPL